jgi:hypothetical protein
MKYAFSLTFLSLALAASDGANPAKPEAEDIQPFAALRWDDGLFDVITKFRQMPGITSLLWSTPNAAKKEEQNVIRVSQPADLSRGAPVLYYQNFTPFVDSNHKPARAPTNPQDAKIIADPINIAGIPFKATATLTRQFGFAVRHPEKVISFTNEKGPARLPVVLTAIQLRSESPVIPDRIGDLIATAKQKYANGRTTTYANGITTTGNITPGGGFSTGGNFEAIDAHGHTFSIAWNARSVTIDYYSKGTAEAWNEAYRKHLAGAVVPPPNDQKAGL